LKKMVKSTQEKKMIMKATKEDLYLKD
jgi:hypothetical protein